MRRYLVYGLIILGAIAGLVLIYSVQPYRLRVDFGTPQDVTYTARFYPAENNPAFNFRWSRRESFLNVPYPGSPFEIRLRLGAPRPTPVPVELVISANGVEISRLQLDGEIKEYNLRSNVLVWGGTDLALSFKVVPTFAEGTGTNNRQDLGVVLDWVEVESARNRLGLSIPPPLVVLWWLGVALLPFLLNIWLGLRRQIAMILVIITYLIIILLYLIPATAENLRSNWLIIGLQIITAQLVIFLGLKLFVTRHSSLIPRLPTSLLLFLGLMFLYLATGRGYMSYGDDIAMYAATMAIADGNATESLNRYLNFPTDPPEYSKYGIGQSLIGLPFYWLGSGLAKALPFMPGGLERGFVTLFILLTNAFVTAGATVALYWLVQSLGYGRWIAFTVGVMLGGLSMAWHYSRTFLSEPLAMLCLTVAMAAQVEAVKPEAKYNKRWFWLALAGFALGLAAATRSFNAALLPFFGLHLLVYCYKSGWRQIVLSMIAWIVPLGFWLGIVGWYNAVRFGSILETGYRSEVEGFTTPLFTGLYGLLFSTGKSIFLFSPVLVLGIIGLGWFWRGRVAHTLLMAMIVLAHLFIYGTWYDWEGGGVWGTRFLLPVFPFVVAWSAPVWAYWLEWRTRNWQKAVSGIIVVGICTLSLFVQFLSIIVSYQIYATRYTRDSALKEKMLYSLPDSPIFEHWRLWQGGNRLDFATRIYTETPFARFVETFQTAMGWGLVIIILLGLLHYPAKIFAPNRGS
jgi:4-amino-4-deoxy-L-arabinose transferase-like glycosyltransferase